MEFGFIKAVVTIPGAWGYAMPMSSQNPRGSPVASFLYFFSRELFLVAVHGWFALQTNVWKVQNTTGRFLAQLHPSKFFSLNPFPSAKSYQFMNFLAAMF